MKKNLLFALILFAGGKLQAQTVTSVADGNFSDSLSWDCNCVPSPGNNIIIKNNINLDVDFSYSSGSVTINPESKLSEGLSTHSFTITGGSFTNYGTLRVSHLNCMGGTFVNHHNVTAVLSFDIASGVNAINNDIISSQDSLHIHSGGGLDNTGEIFALYAVCDGTINNNGTFSGYHFHANGALTNATAAEMKYTNIYNNGHFNNDGDVLTYSDFINNDTLVNTSTMSVEYNLTNGSTVAPAIVLANNGIITVGHNFYNRGTMDGSGSYCVQDVSNNMGAVNGTLAFCDQSGDDFDTNTGTVAITVTFCTAGACILDVQQAENFSIENVYPNPVSSDLNFEMSQAGTYQVSLVNSTGALVAQSSFTGNRTSLDLAHLGPGLYVYHISGKGGVHTGRVVKQ